MLRKHDGADCANCGQSYAEHHLTAKGLMCITQDTLYKAQLSASDADELARMKKLCGW